MLRILTDIDSPCKSIALQELIQAYGGNQKLVSSVFLSWRFRRVFRLKMDAIRKKIALYEFVPVHDQQNL